MATFELALSSLASEDESVDAVDSSDGDSDAGVDPEPDPEPEPASVISVSGVELIADGRDKRGESGDTRVELDKTTSLQPTGLSLSHSTSTSASASFT